MVDGNNNGKKDYNLVDEIIEGKDTPSEDGQSTPLDQQKPQKKVSDYEKKNEEKQSAAEKNNTSPKISQESEKSIIRDEKKNNIKTKENIIPANTFRKDHQDARSHKEQKLKNKAQDKDTHHKGQAHESKKNLLINIYEHHYKTLLIFSVMLLVISIGIIGYKIATTGEFVSKGITLKGGLTITISNAGTIDTDLLEHKLRNAFPKSDISARSFKESGSGYGLVVEASDTSEEELMNAIRQQIPGIDDKEYSSETTGPSLGSAFFNQTLKAIFVAFLFMSLVIYLYFGHSIAFKWIASFLSIIAGIIMFYANNWITYAIPLLILAGLIVLYFKENIPSLAIILCAVSDVLFSLAIFNILDMKLNTAGVAAFLMLVGYSIDTDILLSVRVLKRKEGDIFHRVMGALKTGMMMSISALIAVLTAYFLTSSAVIKEIMFILSIGLIGDIIFTWIQNAGILRWHLEKKGWK